MNNPTTRRAAPRPRVPYSEVVAQAICGRIEAGSPLASICRRQGMPPRSTVEHWLKIHGEFADAYAQALSAGADRRTHGRPSGYSLDAALAFCERIGMGEGVHKACSAAGMPSPSAIYRWARQHPEFEALFRLARDIQAQRLFDEVREIADQATPSTLQVDRTRIAARQWQVSKMAARKFGAIAPVAEADEVKGGFNVEVVKFGPNPDTE